MQSLPRESSEHDLTRDSVEGVQPYFDTHLRQRAPLLELVRHLHGAGVVGFTRRCRAKPFMFTVSEKNRVQRLTILTCLLFCTGREFGV